MNRYRSGRGYSMCIPALISEDALLAELDRARAANRPIEYALLLHDARERFARMLETISFN